MRAQVNKGVTWNHVPFDEEATESLLLRSSPGSFLSDRQFTWRFTVTHYTLAKCCHHEGGRLKHVPFKHTNITQLRVGTQYLGSESIKGGLARRLLWCTAGIS